MSDPFFPDTSGRSVELADIAEAALRAQVTCATGAYNAHGSLVGWEVASRETISLPDGPKLFVFSTRYYDPAYAVVAGSPQDAIDAVKRFVRDSGCKAAAAWQQATPDALPRKRYEDGTISSVYSMRVYAAGEVLEYEPG